MFAGIRIDATLIILLLSVSYSHGQTTIWLSDNDTYKDLDITTAAPLGTTGSFDIWVKTDELDRLQSVSLDVMSIGDAIELTGAEIVIGRARFGRYIEPMVGLDGTMITNISALAALSSGGSGIGPGVPVDSVALDAYRFATIHFRIARQGLSELQLKVGPWLIVCPCPLPHMGLHLGIDDPISNNVVAGATDTVIDGRIRVVPEPNSHVLLLVGGFWPFSAPIARLVDTVCGTSCSRRPAKEC
jgi:hypothetical protein